MLQLMSRVLKIINYAPLLNASILGANSVWVYYRFRRQGLLAGQLMSPVLKIMKNYAPLLNACLDLTGF